LSAYSPAEKSASRYVLFLDYANLLFFKDIQVGKEAEKAARYFALFGNFGGSGNDGCNP
jgi:hypothetical protein